MGGALEGGAPLQWGEVVMERPAFQLQKCTERIRVHERDCEKRSQVSVTRYGSQGMGHKVWGIRYGSQGMGHKVWVKRYR